MPKVPSFEELQQSDKYVPSFEELQKAEAALYGTPEEFGEQDVTDKTLGQKALKFLQNIPAAQAAGLMPIAAKGLAGIPESPFQFASQFAKEPGEAPTMEEVMSVAGVPQTPIPIPEIEPGLGISIPTSAMAKMAEKLSGIKAPEFPETAPATEVAAQAALMATDPTLVLSGAKEAIGPAISGAYKTGKELTKLGAGATAGLVGAPLPSLNGQTFGRAAEFAGKAYGGTEKAFQAMENVPKLVAQEWKNLKPSIKPKFVEQYELANQVGINPDLLAENARLIYGPDAFVTKAKASKSALTPALEAQKFDQLQVEVSNALVNQAEKVSNGRLSAPNKVATGEAIRKGWDDAVSNLFEEANLRYSHLPKEIPSGALDRNSSEAFYSILGKLEEQEQKSLKYASTAAAKKPHAANIEAIQSIRNNIFETVPKEETFVGKFLRTIQGKVQPTERVFVGDLGQAIDQLQQIGREAYSSQSFFGMSEIPANKSLLKNLYGDLKSVILETVKKEKPELLDELIKSNKKQAEFFEKNKFIGDIIQNEKKAPEEVYNELIKSANSNRLNAVKDILGNTEAIDYIKGQVLFDLLESKSVANVPLYNNVNKIMKSENFGRIKNTLFDKGDSDLFERVIELGQDIGAREFNPSRSGIVVKALEYLQKPITGIKAAVTGKTMTDLLESQAYRDYFKDEPLQYIFERRVRGGFNENLLDDVIVERLKEPTIKKEFETAINQGRVPKSLQDAYIEVGKKESPINRYSALKSMATYASKFTDQVTPNNTTIAYRTLQAANHVNKIKYGPEKNVPIFIPEEDRESVITSIKDSKMSSIQKAKNVRNINQYGYLLDIRGFDGEEKEPIQKLLIEKEIIKPSESKSIKQDRPDILKKLEEKESK